jgi:hypothetical protein
LRPAGFRESHGEARGSLFCPVNAGSQGGGGGGWGAQDGFSGHVEVAFLVVNQSTVPGWSYMLENGATTLWEHWEFNDNTYSDNQSGGALGQRALEFGHFAE